MIELLVLAVIFIVIGFFVGKWWFEQQKWSDKRKDLEHKYEKELMQLKHQYEKDILERDKEIEKRNKDLGIMYIKDVEELKSLVTQYEKYLRQDAVKRSRVSILGKVWEQIAPSLKNFPFQPEDARFVGAPIDYIVFEGMGEKDIKKVHFVEIKSGRANLNKQEKTLKDTILKKKVYWKEIRVGDEDQVERSRMKQEEDEDVIGKHELYKNFEIKIRNMKNKLSGKDCNTDANPEDPEDLEESENNEEYDDSEK